jgi:hypothetical protein
MRIASAKAIKSSTFIPHAKPLPNAENSIINHTLFIKWNYTVNFIQKKCLLLNIGYNFLKYFQRRQDAKENNLSCAPAPKPFGL